MGSSLVGLLYSLLDLKHKRILPLHSTGTYKGSVPNSLRPSLKIAELSWHVINNNFLLNLFHPFTQLPYQKFGSGREKSKHSYQIWYICRKPNMLYQRVITKTALQVRIIYPLNLLSFIVVRLIDFSFFWQCCWPSNSPHMDLFRQILSFSEKGSTACIQYNSSALEYISVVPGKWRAKSSKTCFE